MSPAIAAGAAALLALTTFASPAAAEGFASRDLTGITARLSEALGPGAQAKTAPPRVTLSCETCTGAPVVDVMIGRQTDGTEQRVRSGQTTIAELEKLCQARSPGCRMSALQVAPAVGWVSIYPMGAQQGVTAVIMRDGDMLVVRALSTDAAVARRTCEKMVSALGPVIGR